MNAKISQKLDVIGKMETDLESAHQSWSKLSVNQRQHKLCSINFFNHQIEV